MELLSNRVLDPFPQGLMEKSMDLLGGLRSTMEGERGSFFSVWACWNQQEEEERRWGGRG